jgi:hypothetical protein
MRPLDLNNFIAVLLSGVQNNSLQTTFNKTTQNESVAIRVA